MFKDKLFLFYFHSSVISNKILKTNKVLSRAGNDNKMKEFHFLNVYSSCLNIVKCLFYYLPNGP